MDLQTFTDDANVVIAGASGGIGAELVRQLSAGGRTRRVFALHRSGAPEFAPNVMTIPFSLDDEESIRSAAEQVARHGPVDIVIVATGILHTAALQPEKSIGEIDSKAMLEVFRINTIGPALLAKHFLPLMRRGAKSVFAALSARVGSISDNRLGGWASYRASKAALNMLLKTCAIEQRRRRPDSIVVALHPGTVDTRLSAPFQRGVPEGKLFSPSCSAERLIEVIEQLVADDSGRFFAWDGQSIEY